MEHHLPEELRKVQSTPAEIKHFVKMNTGPLRNINTFTKNNQNRHKNYHSPTVSSRMKNMVKTMNIYNFRKIPFVVAKSTTPSHNLGLNIQQVLSIMKGRQKIGNIPPVMAASMGK